jgi:hypothetical protein
VPPPAVLDCGPVGATRRSLAIACALVFAIVPAAAGAKADLTVSVSRLTVPSKLQGGQKVAFGVRYVVRGPAGQRAVAKVALRLNGKGSLYTVSSLPARVRPAIWKWNVRDTLPALTPGTYRALVTITLTRAGKRIASVRAIRSVKVT